MCVISFVMSSFIIQLINTRHGFGLLTDLAVWAQIPLLFPEGMNSKKYLLSQINLKTLIDKLDISLFNVVIVYSIHEAMTLYKLRAAPSVLVEDDYNKNTIPVILELASYEKNELHMLCYEKPASLWGCVFKNRNVIYLEDANSDQLDKLAISQCSVIIDSVNQMSLCLGWSECLKYLMRLISNKNVLQLLIIFHKDCWSHSSKIQTHLHHIASAIVSYDTIDSSKIWVQLKRGGKIVKTEEIIAYDSRTSTLKSNIVMKDAKGVEPEKLLPSSLTTFKIEMEQTEKLEKNKLLLPYMSKINEGESKVYYEPDAVDDWDEEDPDEDLDI